MILLGTDTLLLLLAAALFGALIGYSAAQRKGFSTVGGIIGGLLLGVLSPLMYLVSAENKRCPACAEWIKKQASVCRHCGADFAARAVERSRICPSCGIAYPSTFTECRKCGVEFGS